jgi:hypothetical protein
MDATNKPADWVVKAILGNPDVAEAFRAGLATDAPPAPVAKPDAVSGLPPRFTPGMPLPPGAVLVYTQYPRDDWYWTSGGKFIDVEDTGCVHAPCRLPGNDPVVCAARALSLPLAGESNGLEEGEEAWTDERLEAITSPKWVNYAPHADVWWQHCDAAEESNPSLDNLRRWGNAKIGGWVCRRIAKPDEKSAEERLALIDAYYAEKLSARDARVKELDGDVARLKGEVAEARRIIRASWTNVSHDAGAWPYRNGGGA